MQCDQVASGVCGRHNLKQLNFQRRLNTCSCHLSNLPLSLYLSLPSQVITAGDAAPRALKDLRNRCLNPGKYAQHLEHWLAYYPAQQLHIIDGEQLRLNPIDVMNELQRFLKIQPQLDYSHHLRYDVKKGFYCQAVSEKRNKCLGKSKGRQYPAMDERSAKLLQR